MSTLERMVRTRPRGEPGMPEPLADSGPTVDRLAAVESAVRVTLQHSINQPSEFTLASEELAGLRGKTLEEGIRQMLLHIDPRAAGTIRESLSADDVLVEVNSGGTRRVAQLRDTIDQFLRNQELELGISRSIRGGK